VAAAEEEGPRDLDRKRGLATGNGDGPGSLAEIDPKREREVASAIEAGAE
jgi:hypothetical protein